MNDYTGRQIAIFSDIHGLLEPTLAILEDIKSRRITEIYSLGDDIGVGPNPSEVLTALNNYGVKCINGNSEEYTILGTEPFPYFNHSKEESQNWTKSKLNLDQIEQIKNRKHSYDLLVGGMKIGLCHFANDVRIDFDKNSTWSYQNSINYGLENPQEQFYFTNSIYQNNMVNALKDNQDSKYNGYRSVYNEPLFGGKSVADYDEIIQGHVHFKFLTEDENVRVRTIRAVAMAFEKDEPIDYASYIIIKEKIKGYDVEEVLVPFNREEMMKQIMQSDMPNTSSILNFVSRR